MKAILGKVVVFFLDVIFCLLILTMLAAAALMNFLILEPIERIKCRIIGDAESKKNPRHDAGGS